MERSTPFGSQVVSPLYNSDLRYNPIAIAFWGLVLLMKKPPASGDLRALLEIAANVDPTAAHGFGAAVMVLASIDERFPRSVLRCTFAGSIRPRFDWDAPKKQTIAGFRQNAQRLLHGVEAEIEWIAKGGAEPAWPDFPQQEPYLRPRLTVGGVAQPNHAATRRLRPKLYCNHHAAALWLSKAAPLFNVLERPWLRELATTYGPWTAIANGAGLDPSDDISHPPSEWNEAYFKLLAHCLGGLGSTEVEGIAVSLMVSLPDAQFFDAVTIFLRHIDALYFNEGGLDEGIAVHLRSVLADRVMSTWGWKRMAGSRDTSVEVHIGPAIATLFFNDHGYFIPTKCYLMPKGIDRLDPFMPVLDKLVADGPSPFVAIVTLNLVEVNPTSRHISVVVTAAKAWVRTYTDDSDFWVDYDIGRRLCVWLEGIWRQEPALLEAGTELRSDVDRLLAELIRVGVADAKRLEEELEQGL